MTAFTFILGVLPMIVATGAGASSRIAIGVPVFYGMMLGTVVGLIVIPLLYILIPNLAGKSVRKLPGRQISQIKKASRFEGLFIIRNIIIYIVK